MLRGWTHAPHHLHLSREYLPLPSIILRALELTETRDRQVIRFIPALIVSEEEMATAMDIFKKAVEEVALEG